MVARGRFVCHLWWQGDALFAIFTSPFPDGKGTFCLPSLLHLFQQWQGGKQGIPLLLPLPLLYHIKTQGP